MHNYIFDAATNGLLLQAEEINPVACKEPRPTYVTRVEITYTNHAGRPVKVSTIEDLKAAINRDYAQSGRIPPGEITVPLKLIIHPRITPAGGYANREKEA